MKVLVTGSSGLVGSAIKKISPNYPHDFIFVTSKDADLTDYKQTWNLFQKYRPDYVIHLAAHVGSLHDNIKNRIDYFDKNIIMNVPLKNTTLSDKKKLIKNFDACLEKFYAFAKNYNWIDQSKATYDFWNRNHIC